MPIRITGMNSGMDTESIITELVKAKTVKKENLVKAQTKLQWKQDAWKELNSKVYALYSKTLSNMRLKSDYSKKATKVSDSSIASVITGTKAVNGVQTLKVEELATTGYLTGAELKDKNDPNKYKSTDKLTDLGVQVGSEIELKVKGETTKITVDEEMTVDSFLKTLKNEGINASFDEKNQRFFISSKESGKDADFSLTAVNEKGIKGLSALGIATSLEVDTAARQAYEKYCKVAGVDANGKTTYELSDDIDTIVAGEMADRIEAFKNNKTELKTVQDEIAVIKSQADYLDDEGKFTLPSAEELKKEIEKKTDDFNKGIGDVTQDELNALNAKLADRERLDELETREKELKTSIAAEEPFIEEVVEEGPDGTQTISYRAKEDAEGNNLLEKSVLERANFAKNILNGGYVSAGATKIAGEDAKIFLNGAEFVSNSNTFEINGLTITAQAKSDKEITITTSDDTDGIYDMVKDFLKEYNELINEMDKLYNADSSKGYEPLTEEEKEAMSEKEIEKWEEKIKNSILRRDSTLSSVSSAMKQIMLQGVKMSDGTQMYLSDFGINTLGYFTSKDNEKNAYHIDGDPDDPGTMSNADKLKTAIANDSEKVIEFFSSLSMSLYNKLGDMMKKTEYSSSFTLYDDVAMKDEYKDYTDKISKQEEKITDFEDRYYKKFSAMETALAKLSSKESAISGLIGM